MKMFVSCILTIIAFLIIGNFTKIEFMSGEYFAICISAILLILAGQVMRG